MVSSARGDATESPVLVPDGAKASPNPDVVVQDAASASVPGYSGYGSDWGYRPCSYWAPALDLDFGQVKTHAVAVQESKTRAGAYPKNRVRRG